RSNEAAFSACTPENDLVMDFASRSIEFRNRFASAKNDFVFHFNSTFGRQPSIRGHSKEPAALCHFAPRFWHRRDPKLHTTRQSFPIPWWICAAVVFFPYAHPGKVSLPPDVGNSQLEWWGKRCKKRMLAARIH